MEYFNIKKEDGGSISCVKEIPAMAQRIVLSLHGFTSSIDSSTNRLLLERLPAEGYGVVCIDLPGHGTGASAAETLRIEGALDSIEAVEKYILREYPGCTISYFGSSFGAYLLGLYISTREHAGREASWRSAAVNMPSLFNKENPTEKERQRLEELESKGYFDMAMDDNRPVRVTKEMFDDLLENDLFKKFDRNRFGAHRIAMAHGRQDDVIDPAEAGRFAAMFDIPLTWFDGEGHSLSNDVHTPGRVVDLAISLYEQ